MQPAIKTFPPALLLKQAVSVPVSYFWGKLVMIHLEKNPFPTALFLTPVVCCGF